MRDRIVKRIDSCLDLKKLSRDIGNYVECIRMEGAIAQLHELLVEVDNILEKEE